MSSGSNTIAEELESVVSAAEISDKSVSSNNLTKELIGSEIESLISLLSIWEPGLQTLSLLTSNFFNFPSSVFSRGNHRKLMNIAIASSVGQTDESYIEDSSAEFVEFCQAFRSGSKLSSGQIKAVSGQKQFSHIESFVLAMALKGFLFKLTDIFGCLEQVGGGTRPEKSLSEYIRKTTELPINMMSSFRLLANYSSNTSTPSIELEKSTGYSWPVLAVLPNKKTIRALSTAIHSNFDNSVTTVGLETKCLAALVYAKATNNNILFAENLRLLASISPDISQRKIRSVVRFASADCETVRLSSYMSNVESAALMLARSSSFTPTGLNEITISSVGSELMPEQIIEISVWLAMQEFLARLYKFYLIEENS